MLLTGCGSDPETCTVTDNEDGTYTLSCPDSEVVLHDGQDGTNGTNGADGEDGANGTNGQDGSDLENLFIGNGVLNGSFEALNNIDLFILSHYHTVTGNLTIYAPDAINLPLLTTVGGTFQLFTATNIYIPNLRNTGEFRLSVKVNTLANLGANPLTVNGSFLAANNEALCDSDITAWLNERVTVIGVTALIQNKVCP
jgi:hypothetical protein